MNAAIEQKNRVAPNVRDEVSPEEWSARVNLAACYRLMDLFDMTELISNHISLRMPGAENEFLINPYGPLYRQMTASCMIRIDYDGNELYNPNSLYKANRSGFVIHSAIHAARKDVACVIHTHTLSGMAVSAMQCGMLPISQISMRWSQALSYHDYESIAHDTDERERLARDLGENNAMILRNHGLLTCGETMQEAFNSMYWLKRACDLQVMFMSCNAELVKCSDAVVEKTWRSYQPGVRRRFGILEWPALLEELDRVDPSYAS